MHQEIKKKIIIDHQLNIYHIQNFFICLSVNYWIDQISDELVKLVIQINHQIDWILSLD